MSLDTKNYYGLGIDFGTNSVRALILDLITGEEISSSVSNFKSGKEGILLSVTDPNLARQHPGDYLESMEIAVKATVDLAIVNNCNLNNIVGIGVDTTGSTPLPVDGNVQPLALSDKFKDNLNAQAWLWKDHTSIEESIKITKLAAKIRPDYIAKCGGAYSSEWFFSKVLHCFNIDKDVFAEASTWLECSDYIPAVLAGISDIKNVKRNVCAAGHKAMYNSDWGGYPDEEYLGKLAPGFETIRTKLDVDAVPVNEIAGYLSEEWANKFGLRIGIPIAVGALDAHIGAIGSGVGEGVLVKIIGTSTCDIMVFNKDKFDKNIPGVSGIVDGSVIPKMIGIEAGQSAVGDIFNWFVSNVLKKDADYHNILTEDAEKLQPGQSGLLALDWNNGNRNVLADFNLTGLIVGQTLHTKDFEIYRALVESTAFGALKIIERMEEFGIKIDKLVNCGGIAEKNPMIMQIYADVLNRPMEVAASSQTVALGAAIVGGFVGTENNELFESIQTIQARVCKVKDNVYNPDPNSVEVYKNLNVLYTKIHDNFGTENNEMNLFDVMKTLIEIKKNIN